MTNDDLRQLVARLRTADNPLVVNNARELFRSAADALEAQARKIERLRKNGALVISKLCDRCLLALDAMQEGHRE